MTDSSDGVCTTDEIRICSNGMRRFVIVKFKNFHSLLFVRKNGIRDVRKSESLCESI